MSSPCVMPGPPPDSDFDVERRLHLPRNFCAHTRDLGCYFAGMSFVAFDTVLPPGSGYLGRTGASTTRKPRKSIRKPGTSLMR
jgi:hypothetical protein